MEGVKKHLAKYPITDDTVLEVAEEATLPVIKIQSFSELCFIKMIKTFTNTLFLGYGYICTNVSS